MLDIVPLNRDERFWTATVLPALVLGDQLERFSEFVDFLAKEASVTPVHKASGFAIAEFSRKKSNGVTRFGVPLRKTKGDATPDLILVVRSPRPIVFGIEAKMFEPVTSVPWQLKQQREHCLEPIAENLEAVTKAKATIISVALVPESHLAALRAQRSAVISWTAILELGPGLGFYRDLLKTAVDQYEHMATFKARYHEGHMHGKDIRDRVAKGDFPPKWIGAQKGRGGNYDTLSRGTWDRTSFTVNWSAQARPSRKWYTPSEFLDLAQTAT